MGREEGRPRPAADLTWESLAGTRCELTLVVLGDASSSAWLKVQSSKLELERRQKEGKVL